MQTNCSCKLNKLQLQKLQFWFCLKQIIRFVHQISTLCLVQFDSCFFDANLAYMLSLLTKLFHCNLICRLQNELFNCNLCYLTKNVDVEFAMWKMLIFEAFQITS